MNVKGTIPIAHRRRRYRRDPITPTPERLKMSLSPEKEIGLHPPTNPPTDRRTDGRAERPAYRPAVIKNGERQQRQREREREGERESFPLCVVSLDLQLDLLLAASAETAW